MDIYPFILFFSLNIFVSLVVIALFPTWHLALVLFSYLCFVFLFVFLTSKYNFLFPLFTGSIYCTLFLLDCFDFAHGYICIGVYFIIFIIIWLILWLPFVWGSSLVSHLWVFVLISLNATTNHLWNPCSDQRSSPETLEWEHWLQDPRLPEN